MSSLGRHRAPSRWARTRRLCSATLVAALVASSAALAVGLTSHAASADDPVTKTWTATREYVDNGITTQQGRNDISMSVSRTANLKSSQQIQVNWSGAHPTAGLVADRNSDQGMFEEYSFILLECRGVDSTTVPANQQISPSTCWTQYSTERYQSSADEFPTWRSDEYAAPADRQVIVGSPSASALASTACPTGARAPTSQRWVSFQDANGTTYPGGASGCAGEAPEAVPANLSSSTVPSNETFGVTAADGTGATNFNIFTNEDHASLGCSQTVACSLVAIPIEGISCDVSGSLSGGNDDPAAADAAAVAAGDEDAGATDMVDEAKSNCETNGVFQPGQQIPQGVSGAPAVDGTLWWSASNWRNRMSVPLSFAPADTACAQASSANSVAVYGSELMTQTTTQWAPHFCLNSKLFSFNHVALPEPEGRSELGSSDIGNIHAAFTTDAPPGGYPSPIVSAPVAVTGFGVAFVADDAKGKQVNKLNLDARLLAKLITESYPDTPSVQASWEITNPQGDVLSTALRTNPLSILQDPEFIALNPGLSSNSTAQASLLSLNTSSDEITALTSYINADPEARSWLEGTPDPWGMQVNPNYKGIELPVSSWPILDSFVLPDPGGTNICLDFNGGVPYLPLIAAPVSRLTFIAQDVQFALAQSQLVCSFTTNQAGEVTTTKLTATGRQGAGQRFMLGLVSLGDAARDGINLASLESQSTTRSTQRITDPTGRTFVAPTNDSMRAAAALLAPNATDNIWDVDYAAMRTTTRGLNAYPGTMPVYAAIPTSGLAPQEASDYAQLLDFADGAGQTQGDGQGQLAAGFLPMTTGNGLGNLVAFTALAAAAVAAQQGVVPAVGGGNLPGADSGGTAGSGASLNQLAAGLASEPQAIAPLAADQATTPVTAPMPAPTTSAPTKKIVAKPVAHLTPRVGSGFAAALLPLLLAVAVAAALINVLVRLRARRPSS